MTVERARVTPARALEGGRPLVSYLLFSYRQEKFIEAAMRSALAQTYQPLEIIVSDDCSPDATYAIIESIAQAYGGPHRLVINRNAHNLGMGAHYQHVFDMARGEVFVLAAGDDLSSPGRTERIMEVFAAEPATGVVYSDMNIVDEGGAIVEPYEHYYAESDINDIQSFVWRSATIFGASFAVHRSLHDAFPQIMAWNEIEDRTLIFRALVSGRRLRHVTEPMVSWRRVGRSSSTNRLYPDARLTRLQRYMPDQTCTRWLLTSFRQNLIDYWSLGAPDRSMEAALHARCAELAMAHALWMESAPRWSALWTALRSGARGGTALKVFLKFKYLGAYLAVIELWRLVRRSGTGAGSGAVASS